MLKEVNIIRLYKPGSKYGIIALLVLALNACNKFQTSTKKNLPASVEITVKQTDTNSYKLKSSNKDTGNKKRRNHEN